MKTHSLLIVVLVSLVACESDETKLAMLRSDRAVACILAEDRPTLAEAARLDSVRGTKGPPSAVLLDSVRYEAGVKCDLATRKLALFMNGR